jgi:hypothetical protein
MRLRNRQGLRASVGRLYLTALTVIAGAAPSVGVHATSVDHIRYALANPPPNGEINLTLAEGVTLPLEGVPLRVLRSKLTLWSTGAGATLDANGGSRHFEIAAGGSVHLESVHLVHGGLVHRGGCVLVSSGATFTARGSMLGDCHVSGEQTEAVRLASVEPPSRIRVASFSGPYLLYLEP